MSLTATIATSNSGATTIVSGETGRAIHVYGFYFTANAAVNVNLQSHTTTTTKTGLTYCAAAGDGISVPYSPYPWLTTVTGESLDINLSGAVAVGGQVIYDFVYV